MQKTKWYQIKFRVVLIILCVIFVKQYSYAVSFYTSVWYDQGSATFYGCSVSDASYVSTIHNLKAEAKFTSPSGRSATTLSTGSSYARADVSLSQLEGDDGTYYFNSFHEGTCTHPGGSHLLLGAFPIPIVGLTSYISFVPTDQFTIHGSQFYRKVTPCNATCSSAVADGKWVSNDVIRQSCHTEIHLYAIIGGSIYCTTYGPGRMHNGPCVCTG